MDIFATSQLSGNVLVIALRRKLFFPHQFPRDFTKIFMRNIVSLRFNGGDQVEMKMIVKTDLVPDMHCLLIISPKFCLLFI